MDTRRREAVEAVFEQALDLSPEARGAWLDARCDGDPAMRADVARLLAAHERAGGILERDPRPLVAALTEPPPPARHIGPYRILRELGRGGMGVVYLGERDDGQFRRRVAIKLLRASPDAEELHRRFLAERQILASLDHACIAQLLDGGVTDGQLPYLVMEYVQGLPITTYCDRNRLDVAARLRLFLDVCAAVSHAHHNLVVHRDLKPGNILVTGDGRVKLLDFGIAKLLNPGLGGLPQPVTRTEFRVMTPEYASPEQVRGEPLATTSDVYALGIVLYELLAGRRPYELTSASPGELSRYVLEREPARPSARVSVAHTGSDADVAVAAARATTPARLRRQLQGDVDAIVLMALRKEPRQRYGSAEALAQDIRRHLEARPVRAHRGNRRYRMQRLLQRHRLAAGAALLVGASLLAGAGVAAWQASAARAERDRAALAAREAREVTEFLVGTFSASRPEEALGETATARDLLARGVARAEELSGEPLVQARMFEAMGRVYRSLSDLPRARALLERAVALRVTHLGPDHLDVADAEFQLAEVLVRQGHFAEAGVASRRAFDTRVRRLGEESVEASISLAQLSGIAVYQTRLEEAERLAVRSLAIRRAVLPPTDTLIGTALELLASTVRRRGRSDESVALLREAIDLYSMRPQSRVQVGYARLRLADILYEDLERNDEAESLYRTAIAEMRGVLGDDNPRLMWAGSDFSGLLSETGRHAEAERLVRGGLAIAERIYGPAHPTTAGQLGAVAAALLAAGRPAEAEPLVRRELAIYDGHYGRAHSATLGALGKLARVLAAQGRMSAADSAAREVLRVRRETFGERDTPLVSIAMAGLAGVLTRAGEFAEAESLLTDALRLYRRNVTGPHRDIRRIQAGLADLYAASGRSAEAARYRRLAGNATPY